LAKIRICSIEGCSNKHDAKGYCKTHYLRMRRHGDPTKTVNGRALKFLQETVLPYDGDECIFWPFGKAGKGRGQIRYEGADWYVHRLVCQIVHGEPPTPEHLATHSCGNGHLGCVTKAHQKWGTHTQNRIDVSIHAELPDRDTKSVKLTRDIVREIRSLYGTVSINKMAKRFGVSRATVSDVINGRTWVWLKD
jgi:hypothetical protein